MSTETVKGGVSASLDTSHLKVPFPFKSKYGNYIGGLPKMLCDCFHTSLVNISLVISFMASSGIS